MTLLAAAHTLALALAANELPPPTAALPEDALLAIEAPGLAGFLERGLDDPTVRGILASELGTLFADATGATPAEALAGLDALAGAPVLPSLAALTERGAAFGVWVREDQPRWTLALAGSDPDRTLDVFERAFEFTGTSLPDPHARRGSAAIWHLGEVSIAVDGGLLLAADGRRTLLAALDRLAAVRPPRHASGRAAHESEPPLLRARFDLARARELERADPEGDASWTEFAELTRRPEGPFVLGTTVAALGTAGEWEIEVAASGDTLSARLVARGVDAGPAEALLPDLSAHAPRPPQVSGILAAATLHRDAARICAQRAELFGPAYAGEFAKAIGDLSLFFGGDDPTEALLPHLSPWLRVVVAPVTYDTAAHPEIEFPAAALILEIVPADGAGSPERIGPRLASAFQTMISIVNVERAQQNRDALVLALDPQVPGTTLTWAHFAPPAPADGVDVRYNLAPACVQVGRWFVFATHRDLAVRIARGLEAESDDTGTDDTRPGDTRPGAAEDGDPVLEVVRLKGDVAAELLEAGRAALIARAMLAEGKSREQAAGELRAVIAIARTFREVRLAIERVGPDALALDLALSVAAEGGR